MTGSITPYNDDSVYYDCRSSNTSPTEDIIELYNKKSVDDVVQGLKQDCFQAFQNYKALETKLYVVAYVTDRAESSGCFLAASSDEETLKIKKRLEELCVSINCLYMKSHDAIQEPQRGSQVIKELQQNRSKLQTISSCAQRLLTSIGYYKSNPGGSIIHQHQIERGIELLKSSRPVIAKKIELEHHPIKEIFKLNHYRLSVVGYETTLIRRE